MLYLGVSEFGWYCTLGYLGMEGSIPKGIWVWIILYLRVSGHGGYCTLGYLGMKGTVP